MSDSFTPGTLVSTLLLSGRKGLRSNPHKAAKREAPPKKPVKEAEAAEEAPKPDEPTCQQESVKHSEEEAAKTAANGSEKEAPMTANGSQKQAGSSTLLGDSAGTRGASILGGLAARPQKKLRARGSVMQQRGAGEAPEKPKPPQVLGRRGPAAAVSQPVLSSSAEAPRQDVAASLMPQEVWERVVDQVRSAVYYWEHLRGQSSWNPPPPQLGWWERLLDPTNSLEFFWNSLTRLTVWHLPIPSTPIQGERGGHGHILASNQKPVEASPKLAFPPGLVSPLKPMLPIKIVPPPPKKDKHSKGTPLFDDAALASMAAMLHGSNAEEPGTLSPVKTPVVVPPPPKARPPGLLTEPVGMMPVASKARSGAAPPTGTGHSAHTSSSTSPPKEPEQEPEQVAETGACSLDSQEGSPHWDLEDLGASLEQPAGEGDSHEPPDTNGNDADNQHDDAKPASEGFLEEDIVIDTADLDFDGKDMWSVLEDKVGVKEDSVDGDEFRVDDEEFI